MSALPQEDDPIFALAAEQSRLSERIEQLSQTVVELANSQAALAEQLGGTESSKRQVPWWPRLSREARQLQWAELIYWLANIVLPRQPALRRSLAGMKGSPIEGCWYRHPDVVDELTMLWATWRAAYDDPKASVIQAAEWLDRWLPGAQRRIERSLKECRRSHVSENDSRWHMKDRDLRQWAGVIEPDPSLES
jgi:hypothetical protein